VQHDGAEVLHDALIASCSDCSTLQCFVLLQSAHILCLVWIEELLLISENSAKQSAQPSSGSQLLRSVEPSLTAYSN
jgi:hypothetical protein